MRAWTRPALVIALVCAALPAQQPNSAAASLTFDGIGTGGTGPFSVPVLTPQTLTMTLGGTAGSPFTIFNAHPALGGTVAASGVPTPFGIVDLAPLAFPPIEIVLDGIGNPGTLLGAIASIGIAGSSSYPVTIGSAVPCGATLANVQAAVVSAGSPAGIVLTAASRLSFLQPDLAPVPISNGDDTTTNVGFSICNNFAFFGQTYSSYWVNSNGSVSFGAGDPTYVENQASFQSGVARAAVIWDDLYPAAPTALTKQDTGTQVVVRWTNCPEFGTTNANTFSITLDLPSRAVTFNYGSVAILDGLAGITPGGNLATTVTVFGPGAPLGRIVDHLAGGSAGAYNGLPMESMNELFVSPATGSQGTFNLSGRTVTFLPLDASATTYGML